jgi:hypothetical protein
MTTIPLLRAYSMWGFHLESKTKPRYFTRRLESMILIFQFWFFKAFESYCGRGLASWGGKMVVSSAYKAISQPLGTGQFFDASYFNF